MWVFFAFILYRTINGQWFSSNTNYFLFIFRIANKSINHSYFNIQESLIGDLLSMDIGGPPPAPAAAAPPSSALDLLGGGLDVLVSKILLWFLKSWNYFICHFEII